MLIAVVILIALLALAHSARAQDALSILKTRCFACHEGQGIEIVDEATALARGDDIVSMIDADLMPPGKLPKLSEAEKKTLRDWLAGASTNATPPGAPPAVPSERKLLDDAWVLTQIQADTPQLDTLYLSLDTLYNAGATQQEIWDAQGAVAKAANLLSTSPQIVEPRKVDATGIVLRIDVAQLGWDSGDLATLLSEYPYHETAFIRGEWFVARALAAPLYYRLLGIPGTQRELDTALGVDRQRFIQNAIVKRAGITDSGVAVRNRAVEWAPSTTGSVRLTYDVANENGTRNIVANPLGFAHDAVEYIFDLPNGLHGYAAIDAQGNLQDAVPENIASDPNQFSGSPTIVPGISCIGCHKQGIQPKVNDVVRDGSPLFELSDLADVQSLYPTRQQFDSLLQRDATRYLRAVKQTTEPFKASAEPIGPLALAYEKPLTLETAALETGTTASRLRNAIQLDTQLQVGGLRPLLYDRTVTRETWEDSAQRAAQLLGK